MAGRLENKKIVLGVTGSIAAYKACEVLRMLQREGAEVRVVMTKASQHFVAPLTFETLSGHEVVKEMFPEHRVIKTRHVSWAEWADAIFVCPASANLIGKVASGLADDFLSTLIMASRRPVVFAPAMDYEMVQNRIYLDNVAKLKTYGYTFIDPQVGHLASGAQGPGRLADYRTLLERLIHNINTAPSLHGKRILITAGPTREYLDPVRYFSNPSSGKMGYALAEAARHRGAEVTLISGPVALEPPIDVRVYKVGTAVEMHDAVLAAWPQNDILFMAAAVADYRPATVAQKKMKKGEDDLSFRMDRNPDILKALLDVDHDGYKVGFAVETDQGIKNASEKLSAKGLNLICLNNPSVPGAAFEGDTNILTMISRDGDITELPKMSKYDAAQAILSRVESEMGLHD